MAGSPVRTSLAIGLLCAQFDIGKPYRQFGQDGNHLTHFSLEGAFYFSAHIRGKRLDLKEGKLNR
jgi:hypothetical protein